jgi:hypothetical protein
MKNCIDLSSALTRRRWYGWKKPTGAGLAGRAASGYCPASASSEAAVALNGRKWQAIEKCVLPASYPRHKLMAAAVQAGSSRLTIAPSRMLFEFSSPLVVPGSNIFAYSPAPDGQGFLATVLSSGQEATLNVITNWEKAAGSAAKKP